MSDRGTMKALGYSEEFSLERDDSPSMAEAPDAVKGMKRFWGKYRGVVRQTVDPEMRGRLWVAVEDVWGPNISSWALPCVPYAGISQGMYVVPPIGANVWVEFEHGHPDYPIWVGGWWGSIADAPLTAKRSAPSLPAFALETMLKHGLVVTDAPYLPYLPSGGVLIGNAVACIAIDMTGVRIFGPTVQVNGDPTGVAVALAALLITK
jgi:Type VI secretion system/phage-baseplate injector OB domain